MAEIDEGVLKSVAEVARLKLSPEESVSLMKDLQGILKHFSAISGLKTEGKEQYYVREMENELREDKSSKPENADGILSQFNKKDERFLSAPKSL